MKLTLLAIVSLAFSGLDYVYGAEGCTRGRLFLSDAASTTVHVFELEDLSSLSTPFYSFDAPGGNGINLQSSGSEKHVATIFRGTASEGFTDGVVAFHNAGISAEDHFDHFDITKSTPTAISNAALSCARPIHYVTHDDKIAVFCDGSFEEPQVNSTVWVLDETKFGMTESAIVFNTTLQGSHHGVAVPVDDDHVMYSLALVDRVNRVPESNSLPATFRVVDYSGNELHSIANTSSPDTSCTGFHGSAASNDLFALACDEDHGGILLVEYARSSSTYTSHALIYPEEYPEHRTGSFSEHPTADYIIGNFNGPDDSFNLMAFRHNDTSIAANQVLTLPETPCVYSLEKGKGEIVLTLLGSGMVHAFMFNGDEWKEIASQKVVPDMPNCTGALMTTGYTSAFVMYQPSQMIYALDLEHVEEGEIEVMPSTLSFTPFDGVVAGVPAEVACRIEHHDHDHENSGTSSGFLSSMLVALSISVASIATI